MQSEYEITECTECGRGRHRITLDGEYTFRLYNSELKKFHITGAGRLSAAALFEIQDILYKRGLSRCLYLIKDRDYTAKALTDKLLKADYPHDIADKIMSRLRLEGFINDRRYAKNYVQSYMASKSCKQITYALLSKGISAELIREAFEESVSAYDMEDLQLEHVKKLIQRKLAALDLKEPVSYETRMKIFAYVSRKGYEYAVIKKAWCDLELAYVCEEE